MLYHSERDGFNAKSFHQKCDNKGATIWIAKTKDTKQLVRGYNPLDWGGNSWKYTTDSFLFYITDEIIFLLQNYVMSKCKICYCLL
jgi:hypothetical protein